MDSEPILSIRDALVWNVQIPTPYQIRESPEFTLMNAIWRFEVDLLSGRNRETNDMFFNIQMRNLCEKETVTPFEIAIFVEEKSRRVQMKCHRMIVCKSETLYKVSFYALCKKLPGFTISSNLVILFLFSSTDRLGLSVKKHETPNSLLTLTQCLTWDTKKPILHQSRVSPSFAFMNSTWELSVNLTSTSTSFHSAYQTSLRSRSEESCPPFLINLYLYHADRNIPYRWEKLDESSKTGENLCKLRFESVFTDEQGFEFYDSLNIVCLFKPPTGLALDPNAINENPLQMHCLSCENKGCFTKNPNVGPDTECVKLEPDFPNFAEEMATLLDRGYMADMKLRCQSSVIPAHRAILAVRSPVFNSKILRAGLNTKVITLNVKDLDPVELLLFLRFIYTGKVHFDLTEKDVYKLYKSSALYEVPSLQKICACYFGRNLNEENFLFILIAAEEHKDMALKNAVFHYILNNPGIINYGKWVQFSKDYPLLAEQVQSKCLSSSN